MAGATTTAMPYMAKAMPRCLQKTYRQESPARLDQTAAAGALENAEEDQHGQIRGEAAHAKN